MQGVTIDDGDGDLASAAAILHQMQQKATSYKLYFMYAAQVTMLGKTRLGHKTVYLLVIWLC